jgi:peptidoglycan/xylan/chitin deacetylase (PgdA/CDA1 family)
MRTLGTTIFVATILAFGLSTTAGAFTPPDSKLAEASRRKITRPIPVVTATPAPMPVSVGTLTVPVLMYHYISPVPRDEIGNKLSHSLRLSPHLFAEQLDLLVQQGYHTVTTPQLWAALNGTARLPAKPIVLTFDDGYDDAYTNASPLLRERGLVGTFFVTVNLVGNPGYMNWDQVRTLAKSGMDVQSHAMDHISMAKLTGGALFAQLAESRRILSERTGTDVRFLAYPCGEFNDATRTVAASVGYYAAFAKDGGARQSQDWAYALRRTRITGTLDARGLDSLLAHL